MARPDLKRGDEGDDVRFLQERLVAHLQNEGIRLSAVDGDFGPITEASVQHSTHARTHRRRHRQRADVAVARAEPGGSSSPSTPAPAQLRMRDTPLDLHDPVPAADPLEYTTLDDINLQLTTFDLQPARRALTFLQPVRSAVRQRRDRGAQPRAAHVAELVRPLECAGGARLGSASTAR